MTDEKYKNIFLSNLTRRDMLKAMGTASAAGILGLSLPHIASAAARRSTPNIVFILSDNTRADFMGFRGHPFIQTPSLDRLAGEGIAFNNAFCTTAFCSPSRASFLTGTYARTHGVLNNSTPWTGKKTVFLEYLKNAGYDTAFIGKFHMPGSGLPKMPFLDTFVSFTIKENQGQYFNCPLVVNGKPEMSRKPYLIEELTDRAIEFIDSSHQNPFCLYLSYKTAHFPFLPPKDLAGMYSDEEVPTLPEADSWLGRTNGNVFEGTMMGSVESLYRRYCEAITGMDREIDRVLKKLDESGLSDNTIVIYAGDNGYLWGEHHLIGINWPYEESIKLPFIVRCPWLVDSPGSTRSQMILNIDLAPTLLELAGFPIPEDMEGESFIPVLTNKSAKGRAAWLYEYYKYFPENVPSMIGVRTDTHKYFEFEKGLKPQLYNLALDPKENNNIYGTPEGDAILPELLEMLETLKEGKRL